MPDILAVSSSSEDLADLERLLRSHDCTVRTARDGAEALALARKVRPDLVVSDVLMPVMDGYYLLWLWKNDAELRDVPFVIYTSVQTGASDEGFAKRLGADAFLPGQLPQSTLWARLTEVLSAPQVSSPSISDAKTFLEHYRKALPRKAGETPPPLTETRQSPRLDPEVMESEREFRQVTEAMPQIVWVTRPDGWHTHFNQRWLDYTGLTLEESLGHGWLAPFHPQDQPAAAVRWAEANARGEPYEIEYRLRAADGTYRWMLGRALPLRNGDGTIVKWMGTCTDIHDLKEAQSEQRIAREQLDRNATLLRMAGSVARLGGWTIDLPDWDLHWSDESAVIHDRPPGYQPTLDEGIDQYLPEHRDQVKRTIEECARSGVPYEFELPKITATGRRVWVRSTGKAVRDSEGRIIRLQGAFQDITERKEAEEAMREKDAITRIAGRMTRTGGWALDIPTGRVFWSDELTHILGYPDITEQQLQDSLSLYLSPGREILEDAIAECMSEGTPFDLEAQLRRGDDSTTWVHLTGEATRDSVGTVTRVHGALQDISHRKRTEQALREQASLLDLAQDAILVKDLDHHILYWNRSAERLYGWTAEEARGRSVLDLLYGDSSSFVSAAEVTLAEGEWTGELEHITRDGRKIIVEGNWSLVRDEDGDPRSILAINTDITQKKELEAQFLRAQRLDSIGTLASGIAHDFNNLLAPIVMGVSFLKRGESREKVLAVVDNIERSAERGKQLVRQILSFARGIDGDRVPVDLRQIIRDTEEMIADVFPKSIAVRQDVDEDLWMSNGDSTQLTQVLLNLFVNARDAMPDGGRLLVRATNTLLDQQMAGQHGAAAGDSFVLIEVSDEGCGIPPEVRERIFEPFFTTKPFGTGSGLGLSTALGIVRSHGGFIDFVTDPGSGTTFRVYLPAQPDAKPAGLLVSDPELAARGSGQLILIVDDEASILNVMRHTLEAYGYRSLVAEDGARALALYEGRRDEIDLVITDMVMPGVDGVELISELRRLNPEVRIIAASGKGNRVDSIPPEIEVSAFLSKPYSAEQLLSVLADLLV